MPITICKIHGESGIVEMCKHLHKKLEKGIYQEYFELPVQTTRMCKKCFEKYKVKKILETVKIDPEKVAELRAKQEGVYAIAPKTYLESAILEAENPKILKKLRAIYKEVAKTRGWKCTSCIDQIQLDYARKTKAPLPFEPFENTLMKEKKVAKVERKIEAHIGLMNESNKYPQRIGSRIWAGSSPQHPLLIEIYRLNDPEGQKELLIAIEEIFAKISKKQRKILFYDTAGWVQKGNLHSFIKGEVISEIIVK